MHLALFILAYFICAILFVSITFLTDVMDLNDDNVAPIGLIILFWPIALIFVSGLTYVEVLKFYKPNIKNFFSRLKITLLAKYIRYKGSKSKKEKQVGLPNWF